MSCWWSPKRYVAPMLALALATTLASCSDHRDDDSGDDKSKARLTPIAKFEATSVTLLRQEFCDRIPQAAITAAVGDVDSADSYANGEAHQITSKVNDVSHEFSCTWTGNRGDVARAWIFAPRVTRQQARELVRAAVGGPGCQAMDGHDFGSPSTGVLCTVRGGRAASYRGLFVDTWVACTLTDRRRQLPEEKLVDRAGKWCVQAVRAAAS